MRLKSPTGRARSCGSARKAGSIKRRGQRVGAGQLHAAAAFWVQQTYVAAVAMAKHRLATMVDPLADDEVQLQVGCVQRGLAGEKRAGLGEVGRQPPTLAIAPFADVSRRAPSSGQRPAEGFVEARRVHHLHHSDVVVQVLADAGQVVHHRVALLLQMRPRADAPLPRGGLPRRPPSPAGARSRSPS